MADAESPLVRFRLWYAVLPPALRALLTANGALYGAWLLLQFVPPAVGFVVDHLALTPLASVAFREPWQLLTHGFLNLEASFWGLISVLFALAWLNWIGRDYEELYGGYRLFGLYVMAGVWGGVIALAFGSLAFPDGIAAASRVAGTWGPLVGVLCAVATLHPDRGIGLFLLGVVPLKWVAIGFLVLDVLFTFRYSPLTTVSHFGAAFVGVVFAKAQQRGVDLGAWARPLFERRPKAPRRATPARTASAPKGGVRRWSGGEEERPARAEPRAPGERRAAPGARPKAATPSEVDRILDKINDAGGGERGMAALTDEERRILRDASRRA